MQRIRGGENPARPGSCQVVQCVRERRAREETQEVGKVRAAGKIMGVFPFEGSGEQPRVSGGWSSNRFVL